MASSAELYARVNRVLEMARSPGSQSSLSKPQRRALLAASRGEVVRVFDNRNSSSLICLGVGSKALWLLLQSHLIGNGRREGNRCPMVLTPEGRAELQLMLNTRLPSIFVRS